MSNDFITPDMVAREVLKIAHEKSTFLGTIDRSYDDSFAKTGAKIGSTLKVRQPNQYEVTDGRTINIQDTDEDTTTITVASQKHVAMRFFSDELAKDIDDFSTRYIEPATKKLISVIEGLCIEQATKDVYNVEGTAGTVVGSSSGDISAIFEARARLNQMLAPKDGRSLQIDSVTMAAIVNGNKGLFVPNGDVGKAFKEGFYGRAGGADWYENERTYVHGVGSDVTVNTGADAAVTDGGTNITMNAGDGNINAGDVFTVAGVYAAHPETKESLGYLQQYVATAASTGAVTVSPPTYLTGAKQNVCSVSGAQLAVTAYNNKTMTFVGTANVSLRQNLMYAKEAFTFVAADLPLMGGADTCARRVQDGLSVRVWKDGDIVNDRLIMRIDILYGFKTLRPEWACRITN